MRYQDKYDEIRTTGEAIQTAAQDSGVDARAILCIIMQESGGNVRVGNTSCWQGVVNTGIVQTHDGARFNPGNPEGSIRQMVVDGTIGTSSGDGLKQCLEHRGWNYYVAFREYNSGALGVNRMIQVMEWVEQAAYLMYQTSYRTRRSPSSLYETSICC